MILSVLLNTSTERRVRGDRPQVKGIWNGRVLYSSILQHSTSMIDLNLIVLEHSF